jgi:hypothetical protein
MELETLKQALHDWTDSDFAGHALMRCLGLLSLDYPQSHVTTSLKHVFWSDNDVGNRLSEMLHMLAELGILDYDEENIRYRWNQDFKGSWELNR